MSEALRDELRELIAGFRTHLELRERSGALGVPAGPSVRVTVTRVESPVAEIHAEPVPAPASQA